MNFGEALIIIKNHDVRRQGWNGKGMWIGLCEPSRDSDCTLPYIYMVTATKQTVPWLASQTDILADDWEAVGEPEARGILTGEKL